jgi:hypothetical protein
MRSFDIHSLVAIDKQYSRFPNFDEKIDKFVDLCLNATSVKDLYQLAKLYTEMFREYVLSIKHVYNSTIGWALVSECACTHLFHAVSAHLIEYPVARFIDVGAGTGVFSHILCELGVPKEKIIALDKPKPTHTLEGQRSFWEITHAVDIQPTDIIFVAWGSGTSHIVDDYVERGGKCVIILGEMTDGCTFPADYFRTNNSDDSSDIDCENPVNTRKIADENIWDIEIHHVPGPASNHSEHISINRRK